MIKREYEKVLQDKKLEEIKKYCVERIFEGMDILINPKKLEILVSDLESYHVVKYGNSSFIITEDRVTRGTVVFMGGSDDK